MNSPKVWYVYKTRSGKVFISEHWQLFHSADKKLDEGSKRDMKKKYPEAIVL